MGAGRPWLPPPKCCAPETEQQDDRGCSRQPGFAGGSGRRLADHRRHQRKRLVVETDPIDRHRIGDVLDLFFAEVLEAEVELAPDLVVGRSGDADAARIGQFLQARRHVHPVAVDVAVIEDDVADIDADAVAELPVFRNGGIVVAERKLHLDRKAQRVHDAGKLDQRAVAGELDGPAVILRGSGIEDIAAVPPKGRHSALLIQAHQAGVAHHVEGKDRGQATFHAQSPLPGRLEPFRFGLKQF